MYRCTLHLAPCTLHLAPCTLHLAASSLIHDYLDAAGHGLEDTGALFRSASNNRVKESQKPITPDGVYRLVQKYSEESIKKRGVFLFSLLCT